jgi:hypothetical protein
VREEGKGEEEGRKGGGRKGERKEGERKGGGRKEGRDRPRCRSWVVVWGHHCPRPSL